MSRLEDRVVEETWTVQASSIRSNWACRGARTRTPVVSSKRGILGMSTSTIVSVGLKALGMHHVAQRTPSHRGSLAVSPCPH
jgi:hypothetical protein